MEELRPCPFCGGPAFVNLTLTRIVPKKFLYYVECNKCSMKTFYRDTEKEAIDFWNNRVTDNKKAAQDSTPEAV